MAKIPRIEVHGEAPDGSVYVLNKLDLENARILNAAGLGLETNLAMLRLIATNMALRWQKYFPKDKIHVAEV